MHYIFKLECCNLKKTANFRWNQLSLLSIRTKSQTNRHQLSNEEKVSFQANAFLNPIFAENAY